MSGARLDPVFQEHGRLCTPEGDGALGGQDLQETPFRRREVVRFLEVQYDHPKGLAIQEHRQRRVGDRKNPAGAALEFRVGVLQRARVLEVPRLFHTQDVRDQHVVLDRSLLPEGRNTVFVALAAGNLHLLVGLVDGQHDPGTGSDGLYGGRQDDLDDLALGGGGGQRLGDLLDVRRQWSTDPKSAPGPGYDVIPQRTGFSLRTPLADP